MKKVKPVVARNAKELAKALGLTPSDAVEFEIRSSLNDKIIEVVNERGLTHAQVAKLSHTSRTRVTAILNRTRMIFRRILCYEFLGRSACKRNFSSRKPRELVVVNNTHDFVSDDGSVYCTEMSTVSSWPGGEYL